MNNLIGGNKIIELYKKTNSNANEIGEVENDIDFEISKLFSTKDYITSFNGFLDYMSGEVGSANFKAPINESTHIFISDFVNINEDAENLIAVIDNKGYEVKYIDNPMELNEQLEIYLKLLGGQ